MPWLSQWRTLEPQWCTWLPVPVLWRLEPRGKTGKMAEKFESLGGVEWDFKAWFEDLFKDSCFLFLFFLEIILVASISICHHSWNETTSKSHKWIDSNTFSTPLCWDAADLVICIILLSTGSDCVGTSRKIWDLTGHTLQLVEQTAPEKWHNSHNMRYWPYIYIIYYINRYNSVRTYYYTYLNIDNI